MRKLLRRLRPSAKFSWEAKTFTILFVLFVLCVIAAFATTFYSGFYISEKRAEKRMRAELDLLENKTIDNVISFFQKQELSVGKKEEKLFGSYAADAGCGLTVNEIPVVILKYPSKQRAKDAVSSLIHATDNGPFVLIVGIYGKEYEEYVEKYDKKIENIFMKFR